MSKHISRKQRWTRQSSTAYTSAEGTVVYRERAWYGLLDYRTRTADQGTMPVWVRQTRQFGPYKRPRNAMVAVEQEATILKNRHGPDLLFGDQVWAEQ